LSPKENFSSLFFLAKRVPGRQNDVMITIVSWVVGGCILLFFEVFFPSGMLMCMSMMAFLAAVAKSYLAWGPYWGTAAFAIIALAAWGTVVVELHIISVTGLGKKLFLKDKIASQSNSSDAFKGCIGKQGVAQTPLNLSGKVEVEGKTYEAQSELGPIEVGAKVRVTDVGPNGLKVSKE
jgi:membrane-bound ClpP family serine protease